MGSLYRVRNFCQGLTELGHKCFIFSPYIFSEDWGPLVKFIQIPVLKSRGNISKQIYKIIRWVLDLQFLSRYTILQPKILNSMISRVSQGLFNVINSEFIYLDVIIGESELGGLMLIRIKEKLKIPIIVDLQNYWPEELVENNIIKRNHKRYKFLVALEKSVIDNVDLVITPSLALKKFLANKFTNGNYLKIKAIINGGIPFLDKPKKKEFPPKIIMSGLVAYRSNYQLFLESLPYVLRKHPDTLIYVTRKGEDLKKMMKLAKNRKIKINWYWKASYKEFLDFLADFHVGIVTSSHNLSRKLGFVTKIYDYFSVGVPVVGNDIGGWTSLIHKEKVGLLSSNDPQDLANKILQFIDNPDMSYEYGERGIKLLKDKYSVKKSSRNLMECIELINDN